MRRKVILYWAYNQTAWLWECKRTELPPVWCHLFDVCFPPRQKWHRVCQQESFKAHVFNQYMKDSSQTVFFFQETFRFPKVKLFMVEKPSFEVCCKKINKVKSSAAVFIEWSLKWTANASRDLNPFVKFPIRKRQYLFVIKLVASMVFNFWAR